MNIFGRFRNGKAYPIRAIVHIAGDPHILITDGRRYLTFRVAEAPGVEFRLEMLPTTPRRRDGDRVEITYSIRDDATAVVESMYAAS